MANNAQADSTSNRMWRLKCNFLHCLDLHCFVTLFPWFIHCFYAVTMLVYLSIVSLVFNIVSIYIMFIAFKNI